jgi:cation diffusion facilitator family transporter
MNHTRKEISVQRIAVIVGFGLLLVKFFAWYITNSNTILTDALESIVNVVAGSLALYGVTLSAKPKDEDHPYGHGKIEFIVSGIEGGMIAGAGLLMIIKSALNFFEPNEVQHID